MKGRTAPSHVLVAFLQVGKDGKTLFRGPAETLKMLRRLILLVNLIY